MPYVVKMELGLLGAWWDTGEPVTQARQAKKAQLFCFVLVLFHWPIFGWWAIPEKDWERPLSNDFDHGAQR